MSALEDRVAGGLNSLSWAPGLGVVSKVAIAVE